MSARKQWKHVAPFGKLTSLWKKSIIFPYKWCIFNSKLLVYIGGIHWKWIPWHFMAWIVSSWDQVLAKPPWRRTICSAFKKWKLRTKMEPDHGISTSLTYIMSMIIQIHQRDRKTTSKHHITYILAFYLTFSLTFYEEFYLTS